MLCGVFVLSRSLTIQASSSWIGFLCPPGGFSISGFHDLSEAMPYELLLGLLIPCVLIGCVLVASFGVWASVSFILVYWHIIVNTR